MDNKEIIEMLLLDTSRKYLSEVCSLSNITLTKEQFEAVALLMKEQAIKACNSHIQMHKEIQKEMLERVNE